MNKCMFTIRLTRDPEIRYSQGDNAISIANFCGAVERRFNNQEQSADFLNFKAFGKTAEIVEKFARKGMKFIVESRAQAGSYINKDGIKVYTTDFIVDSIEFAESKQSGSGGGGNSRTTDNSFMDIPGDDLEELPFS